MPAVNRSELRPLDDQRDCGDGTNAGNGHQDVEAPGQIGLDLDLDQTAQLPIDLCNLFLYLPQTREAD